MLSSQINVKSRGYGSASMGDKLVQYEIRPETVGQYTGLKDKNGKEIYEGDTCQCFCFDDKYFQNEVVYQNGAFGYCMKYQGFIAFAENHNFKWENGKSERIEVIGNIHDKKEIATCETEAN